MIFTTCHESAPDGEKLLEIASVRVAIKPYDQERWLYIDGPGARAEQGKNGSVTAIMRKLIEYFQKVESTEVWLGTESSDVATNALFVSLEPEEVERFTD